MIPYRNIEQMNYLIVGGSGFIGSHLAKYILSNANTPFEIYNLDITGNNAPNAGYINTDVRQPININIPDIGASIIFNLAAVHKSPGHSIDEYFEANILGAENVCNFARKNNIETIVFTSSIAPYGISEAVKTEDSLPMPNTSYGTSKLNAEYIHKIWQAEQPDKRKLIIVRPGVVFGLNEKGNFTRLYNSLKKGFFFYPGRKDTIKATVYVKDVCRILHEAAQNEQPGILMLNLTYSPAPTIQTICKVIANVTNTNQPKIVVPPWALNVAAGAVYSFTKMFGKEVSGIHPDRVKKLMISTNISGDSLKNSRYSLQYTFEEAVNDWYNDCEQQGLF